jgi:hypothetical protein
VNVLSVGSGSVINRFQVTTSGFAEAITAGPDGNMWTVVRSGTGTQIARITPSGTVTLFSTGDTNTSLLARIATADVGDATVTVTGTGGGLTRTTTIALTVPPVQGDTASSTVSIVASGGFAGVVSFGASGLPDGVTASFSPAATAGPDTLLTLTVSATAAVGRATVTVTGTSGALVRTVDIALVVNPAF